MPRRCLPRTPHVHTQWEKAGRNSWALVTRHRPPVSPRSDTSYVNYFAHWRRYSPPHAPSSYAAEFRDRGAQQHITSPRFPAVPLCGLPCMVIVITADPTLLETIDRAHSGYSVFDFVKPASGCGGGTGKEAERRGRWFPYGGYVYVVVKTTRCVGAGARLGQKRRGVRRRAEWELQQKTRNGGRPA